MVLFADLVQYLSLVSKFKCTQNVLAEWSVFVVPIFRLVRMLREVLSDADKG
jgi:hypothetical protein